MGLGYRGEGRVVAGADTGVRWDHPSLKSHYRGWDGQNVSHDYNWHDAIQNSQSPIDPHGHGTFTVSEMVGDDGLGNQIGVAPGAKWIACRNMDSGGNGTPAWYTDCFQYLIAPYPYNQPDKGDPTKAPDSINNSWGCPPVKAARSTPCRRSWMRFALPASSPRWLPEIPAPAVPVFLIRPQSMPARLALELRT